jgi:hypothetical protein
MFCVLFTIAAVVYFIRPRAGHYAILGLTIAVLLANASTGPAKANMFWLFIGAILLVPLLSRRSAAS